MYVTTHRCHPGGHPTSSMQAPAAHANAPHRVHTGDGPRHVQAALGSNTNREARQQAPGQIANEKWLTARREAQQCDIVNSRICNICHTVPVDERPPFAETKCGKLSQRMHEPIMEKCWLV